jgi:hypothetical protein
MTAKNLGRERLPRHNHPRPHLVALGENWDPAENCKLNVTSNTFRNSTLGDFGVATRIIGEPSFPQTLLIQPFDLNKLAGIDALSVRVFRADTRTGTLTPVWNSDINRRMNFVWSKLIRPGLYVPIGLPRDRVLQEALRQLACNRRMTDTDSVEIAQEMTQQTFEFFLKIPEDALQELRELFAKIEVRTNLRGILPGEINRGTGGHDEEFPLPENATLEAFRERISNLRVLPGGLPEEVLFFPPDVLQHGQPP